MKLTDCFLPVLLACLCVPVAAAQGSWMQLSDQRRNELRDSIEAHRATQREEVRREETQAGRRLTPAELAELRQQVRQQWVPRSDVIHSADSAVPERTTQLVAPRVAPPPAPRLQRP
ncbi:MAG: hypothetical protein EOP78_06665 [Variovorax sp.]|nr:MAG: hypothetical protein EOP78_06665 [Variovorax sp.]